MGKRTSEAKPNFTFRTLPEIKAVLPQSYWHRYHNGVPKAIMDMIRVGSHVKTLVQAVGVIIGPGETVQSQCEEIWLTVRHIKHKGKKDQSFTGQVNTNTGRSNLHGLEFGMMVHFEPKHIIDVGLNRA